MSAAVQIAKMSGAGNDFIVLEAGQAERLTVDLETWARRVCRRGLSAGADGVLVVGRTGADRVRVRFLNPDGSAAFCGNGSRCAARFAVLRGLAKPSMVLETAAGDVPAEVVDDTVRLTLPAPEDRGRIALDVAGGRHEGRWVVAGSPHFVMFVDVPDSAPLEIWGPAIRRDPHFGPEGVNVDLAAVAGDDRLVLRTWERGVETETLACGSGAVAAAFAARLGGRGESIRVLPKSRIALDVTFHGPIAAPREVRLSGDARMIFEGRLSEEAT